MVDLVWGKERPPRPDEKVEALDVQFAGKKFQEKIEDLRKELEKKKSAGLIVCMLQLRMGITMLSIANNRQPCSMRSHGSITSVVTSVSTEKHSSLFKAKDDQYPL